MAKYKKLPVVIEAVQFDPLREHRLELPVGVEGRPQHGIVDWSDERCVFYVTTIQGQNVQIKAGEWVIAESDGLNYYPCDPEVFEAIYEPVTE